MCSRQSLATLREFENLPHTDEKQLIRKNYMSGTIGNIDLIILAQEYIDNQSGATVPRM
jgi:hypothetical protein